eukprot:TRINITY_DN27530_c0_g1_i1.p1 TRINITY_DN27530_c0_g1~~TRINITY_DN27530_c0_g1_i1.p1  ORF type:complete len:100 (-),score=4.34 TRINITY_DN27530_c0_g1_i1:66-365(-)
MCIRDRSLILTSTNYLGGCDSETQPYGSSSLSDMLSPSSSSNPIEAISASAASAARLLLSSSGSDFPISRISWTCACLLYTSDAADEEDSGDLCGRPII